MADKTPSPIPDLTDNQKMALVEVSRKAYAMLINQTSLRSSMEEIDRQYMREKNYTREQWEARISNWRGDASKIQDATIPIMMPQVESALAYMSNVFVTGYPMFPVNSDPSNQDEAKMLEAIITENSITAGYGRELIKFFRDGLKYNIHALECEWKQRNVYSIENDATRPNGAKTKKTLWNGNCLKRIDMYNAIFDPRVHPADMHTDGEFAGYIDLFGRARFKSYINDMAIQPKQADIDRALRSSAVSSAGSYNSPFGYYMPLINPFPMMNQASRGTFDWMAWVTDSIASKDGNFPGMYEVAKLYFRLIPADLGIPAPDSRTPQVWKLIVVNRDVLLYAERQTNAHNMIPMIFGQPIEDGLDMQTKSFAQNVGDLQAIGSALANGYIATMRRNVSDRGLYNPMYVTSKNMASNDPAAKIPVLPAAYGKPLNEIYYPIPFNPGNAEAMLDGVGLVTQWADKVNGQNPAQQGQFVKGNKTQSEYDDVMGHGNGRNQLMALMTEGQVFVPIKEIMKLNILQFQQSGVIYNSKTQQSVTVDVTALREAAVQFKVSDGILPTDKIMSDDNWTTALQTIGSSQQINGAYDIGPMFSYVMSLKEVNLKPFEKSQLQLQYEQALNSWQQVAMNFAKQGQPFNIPQPQPSPQLLQELQLRQQNGGVLPGSDNSSKALSLTQGSTPQTQQQPQRQPVGQQAQQPQGQGVKQ